MHFFAFHCLFFQKIVGGVAMNWDKRARLDKTDKNKPLATLLNLAEAGIDIERKTGA